MVSKIQNLGWNVYCVLLMFIYTYDKFIVICKPRILNEGSEDSVSYRKRKKKKQTNKQTNKKVKKNKQTIKQKTTRFLSSSHFPLYQRNLYNLISSLGRLEAHI